MKAKIFWLTITVLILLSTILASCSSATSSSTTSPPSPQTTQSVSPQTSIAPTPPASSTSTPSSTSVTTTAPPPPTSSTQANWWDKFGTPKYGGSVTLPIKQITPQFDPYTFQNAGGAWCYDPLLSPSWTADRSAWPFSALFVPEQYMTGYIAKSWKITDPETITVQLNQNVRWQNKAPVNGRAFTSADVVFHYDRTMGTGDGYTSPSPYSGGMLSSLKSVTAVDKYTVQFHLNGPCAGAAFLAIADPSDINWFEAPEWVALGGAPTDKPSYSGPLGDWHNVVGTGPWILTDFVNSTSMKYTKNPDYWNTDPRYPQNKTPYLDSVTLLAMTDTATEKAALRTGKIDMMNGISWQDAQTLNSYNLQSAADPDEGGLGISWRNDKAPFNDARVRQALNMAIDRQTIAKTFYHGMVNGNPLGAVTPSYAGYCYAYNDWPQSLKDKYAYDPTKAKELLAEAGYPNGFKTSCLSDGSSDNLLQIFQQYFKAIGVDMEITDMDPTTFQNVTMAGKIDGMSAVSGGYIFPPNRTVNIFYSKGQGSAQLGLNNAPDQVIDDLNAKLQAAASPDEVTSISQALDKEVIEKQYLCIVGAFGPTMFGGGYTYWQSDLKGFSNEQYSVWGGPIVFSRLWIDKGQ